MWNQARIVLVEALVVAAAGGALGWFANALSPRGIELGRNYFPGGPAAGLSAGGAGAARDRLAAKGLQALSHEEALALLQDPRAAQGEVLFVDARDDSQYQAGHIPGAWQLDHYRMGQYLPDLLPAALAARQIVVYCAGGECEDSEFAAVVLQEAGVPRDRIWIYTGGFTAWQQAGHPIESGARCSGLSPSPPASP